MARRLLRLCYLLLQHPFHLHRWLVSRGLATKWIRDFAPFWDTIRPPGLPITDYASYTFMEYVATGEFRAEHPTGDHFDHPAAQVARLLSYVKRREMHPLRMLKVAWVLRRCKTVLEYGAGAAPYAHFIKTAWPLTQTVWTHDRPSLLERYQRWTNVHSTSQPFALKVDAIVCTEVFEHLDDPVSTAKRMMAKANVICFDYVNDGKDGRTDTFAAFRSRGRVEGPDKRGLYVWRRSVAWDGK